MHEQALALWQLLTRFRSLLKCGLKMLRSEFPCQLIRHLESGQDYGKRMFFCLVCSFGCIRGELSQSDFKFMRLEVLDDSLTCVNSIWEKDNAISLIRLASSTLTHSKSYSYVVKLREEVEFHFANNKVFLPGTQNGTVGDMYTKYMTGEMQDSINQATPVLRQLRDQLCSWSCTLIRLR